MKIQEIPFYLKPFFNYYACVVGEFLYGWYWLTRKTCKIEITNAERLNEHAVFALWHGHLNFFFAYTESLKNEAWLNHPYAYILPYHYLLKKLGVVHIALGSSGSDGKKAAIELLEYLKKGHSTTVAVDGPYGPAHEPKSGAFHFAYDAKIPIYPVKCRGKNCLSIPTWDKKTFMIPFVSKLSVTIMDKIEVNQKDEISDCKKRLQEVL